MASGLAVVAYDYAAAHQHIEHGRSGMLAAFDDALQFTYFAVDLVNDTSRIRRLGREARKVTERMDWQLMHGHFEAALLDALTMPASGPEARQSLLRHSKRSGNVALKGDAR
jgi:hypothetical protein